MGGGSWWTSRPGRVIGAPVPRPVAPPPPRPVTPSPPWRPSSHSVAAPWAARGASTLLPLWSGAAAPCWLRRNMRRGAPVRRSSFSRQSWTCWTIAWTSTAGRARQAMPTAGPGGRTGQELSSSCSQQLLMLRQAKAWTLRRWQSACGISRPASLASRPHGGPATAADPSGSAPRTSSWLRWGASCRALCATSWCPRPPHGTRGMPSGMQRTKCGYRPSCK
mmetsp:Transcript_29994/g.84627  ORF Transcript_29994/g.84627 Transcript_29994/m.84627 type:complete len:221 (+) Transcript_29994:1498-2160(+)